MKINSSYKSDHYITMIEILLNNHRRGRGFWKLNCNSLLEDINHVEKIRATIKSVVEENSDADPQLLWVTVKCRIRGTSRDYGTFKKRQEDNSLLELELQLDKYAKMYESKSDPEICQKLKMLNQTLTILCKEKIMVQQLEVEQEILSMVKKNSKYFCEHGEKEFESYYTSDPNMLQEQSNFYEYLYTSDSNISYDHGTEKEFFKSNQSKLSVIDAQ